MDQTQSNNPKDRIGKTKPPLHLIPPAANLLESQVMQLGADKYGAYNWRSEKIQATVYIAALLRHIYQWLDGESIDPESGVSHLAHVRAGTGIMLDAESIGNLIDDRAPNGQASYLIDLLTKKVGEATGMESLDRDLADDPAVLGYGELIREAMEQYRAEQADAITPVPWAYHGPFPVPKLTEDQKNTLFLNLWDRAVEAAYQNAATVFWSLDDAPQPRRKPRVYLAGPMRGIPDFNFEAFDAARDFLTAQGWDVISPADMDRVAGDDSITAQQAETNKVQRRMVERDIEVIRSLDPDLDRIAVLPGWLKSRGAGAEVMVGRWLNLRLLDATTGQPLEPGDFSPMSKALEAYVTATY